LSELPGSGGNAPSGVGQAFGFASRQRLQRNPGKPLNPLRIEQPELDPRHRQYWHAKVRRFDPSPPIAAL
jgi:hypothetical protein